MADTTTRRTVLRRGLLGLATLSLGAGALGPTARAQSRPRLDPDSEQARALSYVTHAGDASGHPAYAAGRRCDTCLFFDPQTQGCQLFPQHSVAPTGWCQSWAPA